MKNLSNHLISMLRLYDHIELPGIGVFALTYTPARLVKESNRLFPPHFSVAFRQDSDVTSEALIHSFMRKEHVSAEKAQAMVGNEMDTLFRALEKQGYVGLPGLGIISADNGSFTFTQDLCLNIGLPALPLYEEYEVEEENMEIAESMERPLEEQAIDYRPEATEIPQHYHYHNPSYYYLPIHKNVAKFAACLMLVFIVGVAALIPIGTINSPSSTASMLPMDIKKTPEVKQATRPIVRNTAASQVSPVEPQVTPEIEISESSADNAVNELSVFSEQVMEEGMAVAPVTTEVLPETVPSPGEDRYFAVVAAFKSEKEANKYLEQNKDKESGLKIVMKSKIRLITVASADVKENLEKEMPEIRNRYPDAWIYTRPQ